jgi:hypothetical protein
MAVHSETGDGTDERADYDIVLKGTLVPRLALPPREQAKLLAWLKEADEVRRIGALEASRYYAG